MSSILTSARHIELRFSYSEDMGMFLAGRFCKQTVLISTVPRFSKLNDIESYIVNHFKSIAFGYMRVVETESNHVKTVMDDDTLAFEHINADINTAISDAILDLEETDLVKTLSYEVAGTTVEVEITIIGEDSVVAQTIENEMESSYLDYAMSVIVGRALPDARDGNKPVHRRSLFAMSQLNNTYNSSYKKSARVVGDVIGKYHPHGDSSVYDTIVRMAQPFSLRYPLVDGQGNFGSVDGDSAAAMRYTEVRMTELAGELLADLDKDTVDYVDNYDGTERIPAVLPTRIPNLLVNGSSGIAVGMATSIPPHNIGEVIDGCLAFMDDRNITSLELAEYVKGPDFPTAGFINGRQGILDAYTTGRGKITMRARAHIETNDRGRETVVVTEIPYQVNKAKLIERIAELVKEQRVEGISALRDESNKDGMRIAIDVKRDFVGEVLLNNLYANTSLQLNFNANMVALTREGTPKRYTLAELIKDFINHRCEVVTRRTIFDLKACRSKYHTLAGLKLAHDNLSEIIEVVRNATNRRQLLEDLQSRTWEVTDTDVLHNDVFALDLDVLAKTAKFTESQAESIVNLKLYQLTGLEHTRILDDLETQYAQIGVFESILKDSDVLMDVIRGELLDVRDKYADERRTEIDDAYQSLDTEDYIADEQIVITLSKEGYVKYQALTEYQEQRRGGKGKSSTKMKDEDVIANMLVCNTHDTILCFSNTGRVYWKRGFEFPQGSRLSRGKPIVNILPVDDGEYITTILPVREYHDDHYIVMATRHGLIKKVVMTAFARQRAGGIIAIGLRDNDELIGAGITNGKNDVMLFSDTGKVTRFNEDQFRPMGRTATGVRGMKLPSYGNVVSLIIPDPECNILTATRNGYGKLTALSDYPTKSRGTQGVVSIKVSGRNGNVVGAIQVKHTDSFVIITNEGTLVRTPVEGMAVIGRNTAGVRLMFIDVEESDVRVVGLQAVVEVDTVAE